VPVAGWNISVLPGHHWKHFIGVTVGILAGSVALIGFGADSIIEVALELRLTMVAGGRLD
jgi:hypothetical protein